jgi:hypothetical protein
MAVRGRQKHLQRATGFTTPPARTEGALSHHHRRHIERRGRSGRKGALLLEGTQADSPHHAEWSEGVSSTVKISSAAASPSAAA